MVADVAGWRDVLVHAFAFGWLSTATGEGDFAAKCGQVSLILLITLHAMQIPSARFLSFVQNALHSSQRLGDGWFVFILVCAA